MACHYLCTIGPDRDHHGTSEYRCIDEYGYWLPFLDDGEAVDPEEQHIEAIRNRMIETFQRSTA